MLVYTDVNIATQLLIDAMRDEFDTAVLVSGDSDLAPPLLAIRDHFPQKRVVVAFPPRRYSKKLEQAAQAHLKIGRALLAGCQMPDTLCGPGGEIYSRPAKWR